MKIFVVGNSRSGTKMMGRILGNSPRIFTFHELHFFEQLWMPEDKRLLRRSEQTRLAARLLTIQRDGYFHQKSPDVYVEEAAQIVGGLPSQVEPPRVYEAFLEYESRRHGKDVPCDQTPRNVLFLGEIFRFFPDAYVINMVRDPRDVVLSQKRRWQRAFLSQKGAVPLSSAVRYWVNYHPVSISLLWNANLEAARRFADHPRLFELRFEDFLQAPEEWLAKICAWLGIEYSSEYLLVPQVGSSHEKDNPQARGIRREVAERWLTAPRQDWADLAICERLCSQNMHNLGYREGHIRRNLLAMVWLWLLWPIKAGLAVFFNVQRSRSIIRSVARRLKLLK